MKNRLIQAYRQAPWRLEKQYIGIFALVVVLIASVAWIYLNVSAQAANTGLDILNDEDTILGLNRQIANDNALLAHLTSYDQMQKRAEALGYIPYTPADAEYLTISGYIPRQTAKLAPPPGQEMVQAPLIRPDYTQSLWDLFITTVLNRGTRQSQVQP